MKKVIILFGIICFILASYFAVGYFVKRYYDEILIIKEAEIKNLKDVNQTTRLNSENTIKSNESLLKKLDSCRNKSSYYQSGFEMNGKSISTLELLEYVNKTADENIKLRNDIKIYKSQLDYKEDLINQFSSKIGMKKNDDGGYSLDEKGAFKTVINDRNLIAEKANKIQDEKNKFKQEAVSNKYLLSMIEKKYGIKASYTIEEDVVNYTIGNSPKLDSALMIYPYFKHKLIKNKKGEWKVKW